ncbi:hypothetical protein R6G85_05700 [Actinotignum urinale]|uniref:Uncharacterized protein n=1 Tax=Actinotignum urinale TaxID=190146 RepID=A0AAW9HX14_9ACTO|nr:hypothetical protein [Actinotignum urinale]MDY5151972.1 hypothetical protein [Actinotignum urinale]MDY5155429.1 hypothetical protein [Actinotignum urinale]
MSHKDVQLIILKIFVDIHEESHGCVLLDTGGHMDSLSYVVDVSKVE